MAEYINSITFDTVFSGSPVVADVGVSITKGPNAN